VVLLTRIIVVEDDIYMREELIDLLNKSGYEAVPVSNFENAVSQILELAPDLILLDINLPYQSGFEKTLRNFGIDGRIETVRGQGYRLREWVNL